MSNRLGGKQGTAYVGTNAIQPPDYTFSDRDPTQYDINNVSLGDFWLNTIDEGLWVLVSLKGIVGSKGSLATWSKLEAGGISALNELTGNTGGAVTADPSSNINIIGDDVGVTITGDPLTHTLTVSLVGGGIAAESFPTDDGTAIPAAGVLNIEADTASVNSGSSVSFSATGNTVTFNVTDSNDNTIIGRGSGNTTIAGGDNVVLGEGSAFALTSGDDNTIIGGTAGTGITSGSNNIIVGSGAGTLLTISDSANTLIGGEGFAGAAEFVEITAGAVGTTVLHNYPGVDASTTNGGNIFLGTTAGNFTLAGAAGDASNNGIGSFGLQSLTTGARNNAMGVSALASLTTGTNNNVMGHNAGSVLVTGAHNVLLGHTAGSAYTGAESNNIVLGAAAGTAAESNTLRIGSATGTGTGQINKAFISGIRGVTPTINDGIPLFINSVGQIGTVGSFGAAIIQTLTANSGGAVGPSAGNINIVGDGTTVTIVGSPGSNTLTVTALGGGGGGGASVFNADSGSAIEAAGIISIITNNATQDAGASVLFTGSGNTLVLSVSDANDNTLIGEASGNGTLTGTKNVALGTLTANAITSGTKNALLGYGAGTTVTSGSFNTLLGYLAGSAYVSSETSNISINAVGTAAESNVLRIGAGTGAGSQQINKAFISGIRGTTPTINDGIPLFINSVGQLGTVGNGGTTMVQTVTGNSGGAVGPAAGNINIVGDGVTATVVGNPGTNTLTITAVGGGGGGTSVFVTDSGSATESVGTINIITNNATQDAGATVLFSGATDTIQLEVTDANKNTLIGFGTGNGTLSGSNNTALGNSCALALTTGSNNIFLGKQAGSLITTGSGNFLCGDGSTVTALKGTTTSTGLYGFGTNGSVFLHNFGGATSANTFVGYSSGGSFNAGQQASSRNNTGCGTGTLEFITSGTNNVAFGAFAGGITSGSSNTLLGVSAGSNYASSESSNICIGRSTSGTVGESNTLRMAAGTGTGNGQVNKTFIAGIRGITTGISNAIPVVIDSAGQLGTAGGGSVITSLTGNSGGAVSATGGNVNVRGDGTTISVAGSPGTSTLTISAIGGGGNSPAFAVYKTTDQVVPFSPPGIPPVLFVFDAVDFNLGSDFNVGTSTFTAPVAGLYNFSWTALTAASTSTRKSVLLVTSNLTYVNPTNFTGVGNRTYDSNSYYSFMDAGDTAAVFYSYVDTASTGTLFIYGVNPFPSPAALGVLTSFGGMLVSTT